MPRLPKKKWKLEERIKVKANLEAQAKFNRSAKGLEASIVRMIDRIDPLEFLGVAATSFMVYDIIKSTPEMLAQAKAFLFTPPIAVAIPFISILIERLFGSQEITEEQKIQLNQLRDEADLMLFVKSFAIAYILVKHSGQIISGVGNITGFVGTFLGLKAV